MLNAGVDLGLIAILVSIVAVGFAGYQAWIGARQTRIQRAAAELSFNLDVITRLGDVQLEIADRPEAHAHVWAGTSSTRPEQDYRPGHVLTLNLIDALELAIQATQRLPGFAVNRRGWGLYAREVFDLSAAVRQEVTEHPEWWPTVSGYLQANGSVVGSRQNVESPDPER